MILIRLILLKRFLNLWLGGKHFSIRFRNSLPMLVCTFLLNGGLNHIMFLCLFLFIDSGDCCCGGVNSHLSVMLLDRVVLPR